MVPLPEHSLQRCNPYPLHVRHSRTVRTRARTAAMMAVLTVIARMACRAAERS